MKRKWDRCTCTTAGSPACSFQMRLCASTGRSRPAEVQALPKSEFRPRNRSWGSQMKIPPTIEPIAHISPYRRIDPSHPGRKRVITLDEWRASGSTRKPDPAIYRYDERNRRWVLKEGVR